MLRWFTAGESHGPAVLAIMEGMPAGLAVDPAVIQDDLGRRQRGHGRGGRMNIERDRVQVVGGIRHGRTTGAPIALVVENRDYANWSKVMNPWPASGTPPVTRPRPGHADLAGAQKYRHGDLRDVIERASARETAARCAAGSIARQFLTCLDMAVWSYVTAIGTVEAAIVSRSREAVESSPVRCPDPRASESMCRAIDAAAAAGDTLGGCFEVMATGVPPGLGSHVQWDRRLDARLAGSLMGINGIKGVEVGLGFATARLPGSEVHDGIYWDGRYHRRTNRAGGIEGGMSNGEDLVLRAAMKPIPTLKKPLPSVDMKDRSAVAAHAERSDVCAVPAAAVVAEAVVALELARAVLEKFGGDSVEDTLAAYRRYLEEVARL
ncbi:MAG: chorismate synthase [Bacillota bacterium]